MSPYFGEAVSYEVVAPTRGALHLHPSRVIRFLGNEWPDPSVGASVWSDSVLQTLYDAIHAVALTNAGATSLMHEAKVDVVTVPNLSEHLASSATTAQLSARFSYAAAMKSINNLLLLGDGETWSRQKIDFAGLPEMVRTFLQVAAGAADIPVTRLLGQSPAGLSATGDSDTRNYYDMIAARQAIDLRPKLERLDDLILRSAGVDPGQVSFDFRPLWQMDAATSATVALNKAQTTQIYAGLKLWPDAVTARLVQSQLMEDGTYPAAEAIFAAATPPRGIVADAGERQDGGVGGLGSARRQGQGIADLFDPNQPRDPNGRWSAGAGEGAAAAVAGGSSPAGQTEGATSLAPENAAYSFSEGEEIQQPSVQMVPPFLENIAEEYGAAAVAAILTYLTVSKLNTKQTGTPSKPEAPVSIPIPTEARKAPSNPTSIPSKPGQGGPPTAAEKAANTGPRASPSGAAAAAPNPLDPNDPRNKDTAAGADTPKPASEIPAPPETQPENPLTTPKPFEPPPNFDPEWLKKIGPGPFARNSIEAGPTARPSTAQQKLIDEIGNTFGCHTCKTMNPETKYRNWVGDHQLPTALVQPGDKQYYFPQCMTCSRTQGGYVRSIMRKGYGQ